jgi:hypothetical protein
MAEKENPFRIDEFRGMNNIKLAEGSFKEPRIVLNADVTEEGRVIKRDGQTKVIDLPGAHSIWADKLAMMCAAPGKLYRIQHGNAVEICSISGPKSPMSYVDVGDLIYASNLYWNGIFDPSDNSIGAWGIPLPEQVVLTGISGNLPAGTYNVCLTNRVGKNISGNGPVSQIILSSGNSGINISNRPANGVTWVTDPDGSVFHLAGETDNIIAPPGMEPLPSFLCSPPLNMENLCLAFGRMWGSVAKNLYYSEGLHFDWFKLSSNLIDFSENIRLIARVKTGLFIGCDNYTKFLKGTVPKEMEVKDAGPGVCKGTVKYCDDLGELGDTISPPEKTHVSVPVWLAKNGFVAGNEAGRLFSLSQRKVKFVPGNEGASLFRKKDGKFQFLTSFKSGSEGSGFGMSDSATCEVIRNGTLI